MIRRRSVFLGALGLVGGTAAAASPQGVDVIFIGDSITHNWPARLLPPLSVNAGVPGQVTRQMLGRFQTDVLAAQPRAVHIWGGVNDLKGGVEPGYVAGNLRAMAEMALDRNVKPILSAVMPARVARDIAQPRLTLNAAVSAYARERGIIFVDYAPLVVGSDGYLAPENTVEGLHLTAEGYAKIAPAALAAVARALGE